MLRVIVLFVSCAVAWSSVATAADDAPLQTSAFIAYCKSNSSGCADKIAEMYAAMLILNTVQIRDRIWCPADEANDIKVLAPRVIGWLTAHPEAGSKTTNDGIQAAVTQLYPCKRR